MDSQLIWLLWLPKKQDFSINCMKHQMANMGFWEKMERAFWKRISDANGFVKSTKEGIKRVKTSPTMYISQYSILEYVAGKDCELAAILDDSNIDNVQYGIAMQKGSPFLGPFNEAIKELKANEKLVELKKKYWNNLCTVWNKNIVNFWSNKKIINRMTKTVFVLWLFFKSYVFLFSC